MATTAELVNRYREIKDNIPSRSQMSSYTTSKTRQYASNYLTDDGIDALKKRFSSAFDDVSFGFGFGAIAETILTTWGTSARMKEGQPFMQAFGAELVENAIFGIAPELAVGLIGKAAIENYPQLNQMAEQKKYFEMNYNFMGGNYIDQQENYTSRARALEHIKRTRSTIANSIGGESRRYHR